MGTADRPRTDSGSGAADPDGDADSDNDGTTDVEGSKRSEEESSRPEVVRDVLGRVVGLAVAVSASQSVPRLAAAAALLPRGTPRT